MTTNTLQKLAVATAAITLSLGAVPAQAEEFLYSGKITDFAYKNSGLLGNPPAPSGFGVNSSVIGSYSLSDTPATQEQDFDAFGFNLKEFSLTFGSTTFIGNPGGDWVGWGDSERFYVEGWQLGTIEDPIGQTVRVDLIFDSKVEAGYLAVFNVIDLFCTAEDVCNEGSLFGAKVEGKVESTDEPGVSVPEPGMIVGLSLLGMSFLRKKKTSFQKVKEATKV